MPRIGNPLWSADLVGIEEDRAKLAHRKGREDAGKQRSSHRAREQQQAGKSPAWEARGVRSRIESAMSATSS